jgi:chemotaxis protein MotC
MTARQLLLSCVVAALISAGPTEAAPRADGARSADFLATLFGAPPPAPVATAAPISVLPPVVAPASVAAPAAEPRSAAARLPPLPRLRPPYAPATSVAAADAEPAAETSVVPAAPGIDGTVTGSIDGMAPPKATAPPAEAVPAEPAAPAAPPAAKHEITMVQRSDGLLGDPSDYLTEEPTAPAPNVPAPDTVEGPKGRLPAAESRDEAALAAVPLLGTEPFELVRTLQSLQDRMAQGDIEAIAAQRALMVQVDKAFMAAGPTVWQDNRNAAAAVTYVLSGGQPEILSRLVTLDPPPSIDRRLLQGVLDYANGRADEAAPLLAEIDPTTLPASMAGQVAIAQSALAVRSDPVKAMQLLAVARLVAPGTLVEEAAIRRQLLVADRQRDEDQVRSLARQYLDRFRHSVYAGNFRVRFAAALSHMSMLDSEERFGELDDMLAMVEPESRCDLYLTVALASAVDGRATAARLAAERASGLALAGSLQEARAKLYHAAALAAMPALTDKAESEIKGVDRKLLAASDKTLYDTVRATLDGVLSGTDLSKINVAAAEPLGDGALADESPIIKKARAALDETEKLVASAK